MGFSGDIAWEFTMFLLRSVVQFFASAFSVFLRLIGRPRKDHKKAAEKAAFEAKNPPANRQLASAKPRGVFFGKRRNQYVVKPEQTDGHVLVVGIPGSGKSSCIAIPTLRHWQGSVFAVDVKGELYAKTRQHRKNIKIFEPQNEKTNYYYDPYVFLAKSNNTAQEARAIAQAIIPLPHDVKEPFWIESAQIILTGAILHYYDAKCTFIQTLVEIQSKSPKALISVVSESVCVKAALCVKPFVDMDGKVLAGISAEISRGITTLITDDEIVKALSCEEGREIISPADLEKGLDIYVKIPENLLRQWKNLLTLMVNQFITFFERRGESRDNRPILFLLDEFPRLGKIPAITDALATLRSKNITICLIVQSLAQLEMIYGNEARKVIADTCAYKAVLGATDADTQEYFSKLVGTFEKVRATQTQSRDFVGAATGSSSSFSEDIEKRIIKPEEFAYLREIILLYPLPLNFCRVQKQPYYEADK